jgi:signal peptidase I
MRKTIISYGKTIIFALLIAFLLTGLIKPTLVKGYSMYPTIRPYSYLIINKLPYITGKPDYGDIIVFTTNIYTEEGEGKNLIKRVIGLEGDTLEIKGGIVYRNGYPIEEDYIYGGVTPGEMELITVSENCVFVMGENRSSSLDSRDSAIGEIPLKDIMGRVDLRLFPLDEIGVIQ